jgi:hypothetical protein
MIKTVELPKSGTIRTRKVFALLPVEFYHGAPDNPQKSTVWLDYYLIDECYTDRTWYYWGTRLNTKELQ